MTTRLVRSLAVAVVLAASLIIGASGRSANAAFPGTNGKIVFTMQDGADSHVWTMKPTGSDRTQLTSASGRTNYAPRVSADGTKIVYVEYIGSTSTLRIRDVIGPSDDGVAGTTGAFAPTWLPDGSGLLFSQDDAGGKSDIFRLDLHTHAVTNITQTTDQSEELPSVSPDGTRIAYAGVTPGAANSDIWVMDIDGKNRMQLTHTPDQDEGDPDWSPDNSRIVFTRWMNSDQYDIFTIGADGQNETPVISGAPDDYNPTFSPDGTMIAFERHLPPVNSQIQGGSGDKYHIFVATVAGGGITDISPPTATSDFSPNWGVDQPGPLPLIWGDNDCSGAIAALDALPTLLHQAGFAAPVEAAVVAAPASGCPAIGQTLHTASFGDRIWGDLDCSGHVDAPDVLLILRYVADLPPANLQDCPALGITVALAPI